MESNSALLLFGSGFTTKQNNPANPHNYEWQNSDFYYLTGFNEPNVALLLINKTREKRHFVFSLPQSNYTKLWSGNMLGPKEVARQLKFNEGFMISEFISTIKELFKTISTIYYPFDTASVNSETYEIIHQTLCNLNESNHRSSLIASQKIVNSDIILAPLRLIKSAAEISDIKKAAEISVGGHLSLLKKLPKLCYEYQAQAELSYHYQKNNAVHAFPPIVAAAENSCILHYTDNNKPIHERDLLLVDSGAQYNHYTADITRTYSPRNSKNINQFSLIYHAVLRTHKLVCKSAKAGIKFASLHNIAVRNIIKELILLGILKESAKKCYTEELYKKYFPHRTSHWIGLDVHDKGQYAGQTLKPGMVFSIEPGLYFAKDDKTVAAKWRGIGVRIEDTLLINNTTKGDTINLTSGLPIDPLQINSLYDSKI